MIFSGRQQFFNRQCPAKLLSVRPRPQVIRCQPCSTTATSWTAYSGHTLHRHSRRNTVTHSVQFEGAIPAGVSVEVKSLSEGEDVEFNPDTKTLRLPVNVVEGSGERRTKLVIFTCNKCGGRTARNVNPVAWEKGLVMGQCATCEVWHVLSAKNKKIFEEIRYNQDPSSDRTTMGAGSGEGGDSGALTNSEAQLKI